MYDSLVYLIKNPRNWKKFIYSVQSSATPDTDRQAYVKKALFKDLTDKEWKELTSKIVAYVDGNQQGFFPELSVEGIFGNCPSSSRHELLKELVCSTQISSKDDLVGVFSRLVDSHLQHVCTQIRSVCIEYLENDKISENQFNEWTTTVTSTVNSIDREEIALKILNDEKDAFLESTQAKMGIDEGVPL